MSGALFESAVIQKAATLIANFKSAFIPTTSITNSRLLVFTCNDSPRGSFNSDSSNGYYLFLIIYCSGVALFICSVLIIRQSNGETPHTV